MGAVDLVFNLSRRLTDSRQDAEDLVQDTFLRPFRPHDPERNAAEYVTGEPSGRARRWFEAHLLHCEDCWREVLLGRLGRRVAEESLGQAPGELRDRVRAAVRFTSDGGPAGPPLGA